jgi:hypothetical protein
MESPKAPRLRGKRMGERRTLSGEDRWAQLGDSITYSTSELIPGTKEDDHQIFSRYRPDQT